MTAVAPNTLKTDATIERSIGVAIVVVALAVIAPLIVYDSVTSPSWWRWAWAGAVFITATTLAGYLWRTRRRRSHGVNAQNRQH